MGNFSNVPEDRLRDAIAKRYVAVRMQQGVPLLDADWNELEDLRRHELETIGAWFIGDGVPVGSDGFHIIPVNADNDFGIRQGTCIVRGKVNTLDADVRYTTQPHFGNPDLVPPLAPLTTPGGATEFVVYLDVWEREVNAEEDGDLIDSRIGLETTVRMLREWAVRVARDPQDVAVLDAPPAGHVFYRLAYLRRKGGNARITGPMIEDLRDTQLSIRRRIELRDNGGTLILDNPRFRLVLEATRNNVLGFVRYITTAFNPISTPMTAAEVLGIQAAMHITRPAEAALALLENQVLANRGALGVLSQLYDAEKAFLDIWRDVVLDLGDSPKKYATYQYFIEELDHRLHDPLIAGDMGLLPAIKAEDLAAASAMQDAIARLFSEESNADVPRGNIEVFLSKPPPSPLTKPQVVIFEFTARSFTTLADSYAVEILPETGWTRRLVDEDGHLIPGNRVPLGAGGAATTIYIQVVVGTGSSDLQLRVSSVSNSREVTDTTDLYTLTEGGDAPEPEGKVRLKVDKAVPPAEYNEAANTITLPAGSPISISVKAFNDSDGPVTLAVSHSFQNAVGAWAASFPDGPSVEVPKPSASFAVDITPGAGADSAKLVITATGSVDGSAVTVQVDPTLLVLSS